MFILPSCCKVLIQVFVVTTAIATSRCNWKNNEANKSMKKQNFHSTYRNWSHIQSAMVASALCIFSSTDTLPSEWAPTRHRLTQWLLFQACQAMENSCPLRRVDRPGREECFSTQLGIPVIKKKKKRRGVQRWKISPSKGLWPVVSPSDSPLSPCPPFLPKCFTLPAHLSLNLSFPQPNFLFFFPFAFHLRPLLSAKSDANAFIDDQDSAKGYPSMAS